MTSGLQANSLIEKLLQRQDKSDGAERGIREEGRTLSRKVAELAARRPSARAFTMAGNLTEAKMRTPQFRGRQLDLVPSATRVGD